MMLHSDLKPENLMMASDDDFADVKIVDFGFATPVQGRSLTRVCGTLSYIAPEILQHQLYGEYPPKQQLLLKYTSFFY